MPYNEIAEAPGLEVIERTPYAQLAALDLSWDVVGCNELPDLNKTVRALMVKLWGEPRRHTTANLLYHDLWLEGCRKAAAARKREEERFVRELRGILG